MLHIRNRSPGPAAVWVSVILLIYLAVSVEVTVAVEELDSIVAVVNNDVIVQSELEHQIAIASAEMQGRGSALPSRAELRRQALDRIILSRLQLQKAEELGIKIDDATLTEAVGNIAARNGMTLEELRAALESGGVKFEDFTADTRLQLITARLQAQEVVKNIQVTDQEVQRFLDREASSLIERTDVRLSHMLVAVPEGASSQTVAKAESKAKDLVRRLRGGAEFAQLARRSSDGRNAAKGGDLGWFPMSQVPSLAQEAARSLAKGQVSDPLRSPSGFHIIKVADLKGSGPEMVTQTHARHILVRTNEVVSDDDAKTRLEQLRMRILGGDDFATLARSHSDDTGSALKGGDLGWVNPGDTVPEFEKVMGSLSPNEISKPFKTTFGWHIVQVLERRSQDTTDEVMKLKAREVLRQRKADEAVDSWLRQIRDEAFVEIRASSAGARDE